MAQWVKDVALSLWQLGSLLRHKFDPWPSIKDLVLLQLQLGLGLAPELPYATDAAKTKQNNTKQTNKKKPPNLLCFILKGEVSS